MSAWDEFEPKLQQLHNLWSALSLLHWDQKVTMPPGGGESRSRAMATLEALTHERFTDPAVGDLLERLADDDSLDEDRRASVRVFRRNYLKATKVPTELVRALAQTTGLTYQAWTEARPAADFSILQPHLTKLLELKKEEADALGWERERYDALLDHFEPGATAAEIEALFAEMVQGLASIVDRVLAARPAKPGFVTAPAEVGQQDRLCRWLVERLGYDLERGRVDTSPHPFTIGVSVGDVRQTIRFRERELLESVYAAIHETGHALYEQGLQERFGDLPVADSPSLGVHESQSRLWENHVGRSRPFTDFLLPQVKERFPSLGSVTPEEFYQGVNHPERTTIRTGADELTYNLHIVLRFELELALFRDELDIDDLPDAWDAAMEKHVGVRPDDVADGVLQDMHWPTGMFGYFPTYSIGTMYAAALYEKAEQDLGGLHDDLRKGETSRLLEWSRVNVHHQGYLYESKELMTNILGEPPTPAPLLRYLADKYSRLYDVSI